MRQASWLVPPSQCWRSPEAALGDKSHDFILRFVQYSVFAFTHLEASSLESNSQTAICLANPERVSDQSSHYSGLKEKEREPLSNIIW